MPVLNSIAARAAQLAEWRRALHRRPEIGFDCHETARFVVDRPSAAGVTEIHEGLARTGVVAIIEGSHSGPTVGLRADMDALEMDDLSGTDHRSEIPGLSHACGHDGHTTMLLGAAEYRAATRNFAGRAALIFQPAEETEGSGRNMVEDGLMERFDIAEIYGLHNMPGIPEGHVRTNRGALLAGVDAFTIRIGGVGGPAAMPHRTRDPMLAAASTVLALQALVFRETDALDRLVVSVTQIRAGTANNVVPDHAILKGTVRFFDVETPTRVKARLAEIAEFQARGFGLIATLDYEDGFPPKINDPAKAAFAADVAREIVGPDAVDDRCDPIMPGQDFALMLQVRPGAYLFVGHGDTPGRHRPAYDFNDRIAPIGASLLARLIGRAMPLASRDSSSLAPGPALAF